MFHVNALMATKFSTMIKTRSLWLCSNKVDSRKLRVEQKVEQLLETVSMIIDRVKAFNDSNKKFVAKSKTNNFPIIDNKKVCIQNISNNISKIYKKNTLSLLKL